MNLRLLTSILCLWALLWCSAPLNSQAAVTHILRGELACDPANPNCVSIPLTFTVLCSATCPFRSSFSFSDSNRFWGASGTGVGSCITSTDGGITWPACDSQPFVTGANELYAGASDGSVIAASTTTGPTTCTISRSTNNGTSWGVVFTSLVNCNPGGQEGQYLYCLSSGVCELATNDASGQLYRIFRSSDNGQNWSIGETGDSFCTAAAGSSWNGSVGIMIGMNPGCGGGGNQKSFLAGGDVWAVSTVWSGTQGDCWGTVIYNGGGRILCQSSGAAPDSRYTLRTSTGAPSASLTLPGALLTSIDAGGIAIGPFTDTLYVFASRATDIGVWVSRDNLSTFALLASTPGVMRGGNIFYSGGCVYATYAGPARFGKICP